MTCLLIFHMIFIVASRCFFGKLLFYVMAFSLPLRYSPLWLFHWYVFSSSNTCLVTFWFFEKSIILVDFFKSDVLKTNYDLFGVKPYASFERQFLYVFLSWDNLSWRSLDKKCGKNVHFSNNINIFALVNREINSFLAFSPKILIKNILAMVSYL